MFNQALWRQFAAQMPQQQPGMGGMNQARQQNAAYIPFGMDTRPQVTTTSGAGPADEQYGGYGNPGFGTPKPPDKPGFAFGQ